MLHCSTPVNIRKLTGMKALGAGHLRLSGRGYVAVQHERMHEAACMKPNRMNTIPACVCRHAQLGPPHPDLASGEHVYWLIMFTLCSYSQPWPSGPRRRL